MQSKRLLSVLNLTLLLLLTACAIGSSEQEFRDYNAPTIRILSPSAGQTVYSDTPLRVIVADDVLVESVEAYLVRRVTYEQRYLGRCGWSAVNYVCIIRPSSIQDGEYSLLVRAADGNGNLNSDVVPELTFSHALGTTLSIDVRTDDEPLEQRLAKRAAQNLLDDLVSDSVLATIAMSLGKTLVTEAMYQNQLMKSVNTMKILGHILDHSYDRLPAAMANGSSAALKLGTVPKDAWGHEMLYFCDGVRYWIISLGSDGRLDKEVFSGRFKGSVGDFLDMYRQHSGATEYIENDIVLQGGPPDGLMFLRYPNRLSAH